MSQPDRTDGASVNAAPPVGADLTVDADLAVPSVPAPSRPARRVSRYRPSVLAAIAAGGALGGPARYGLSLLWPTRADGFPWGTFVVNVSGSLALGVLLVVLIERFPPTRHARSFLATGFLGSYTTFSTYAVETDLLVRSGRGGLAAAYALGSLAAGLLAAWLGVAAGRLLAGMGRT